MKRFVVLMVAGLFALNSLAQNIATPIVKETEIKLFDNGAKRTEIVLPKVNGYTLYKAGRLAKREHRICHCDSE